jgi:cytochrome b561
MAVAPARFSTPAIVLHWAVAALILTNFVLGLRYEDAHGLAKFNILQWHKSVGFTVLALSLIRLGLRLFGGHPPSYPDEMKPWEKAVASATHWSFYGLMIALPLTGWVIISASLTNIPTLLYKTIPFPHIGFVHSLPMATRKRLEDGTGEVHEVLAWIMITLFVLHVAAALKHHFWDKDSVLYRMVPFIRPLRRA